MMLWIGIAGVSGLLIGYIWGKRDGVICGNQQRTVSIPLLLRQQSFEKGYCVLCHESKKKRIIYKLKGQYGKRNRVP
jgi:hypothetical protein